MPTTIHMGKTITQTVAGSDGPLAPGTLAASSNLPGVVSVVVDTANAKVTLQPNAVGTASISYTAAGHQTASDVVTVVAAPPLPTLIVTDGPEV